MTKKHQKWELHHKGSTWALNPNKIQQKKATHKGQEVSILTVKLKSQMNPHVRQINKLKGLVSYRSVSGLDDVYEFLFPFMDLPSLIELANWYYQTGLVEFAEPLFDQTIEPQMPPLTNDPLFGKQWILRNEGQNGGTSGLDPKISDAIEWIKQQGIQPSSDISVAVLDEGVDIDHKDLPKDGKIHKSFSQFGNGTDPRPKSSAHHGTQITGVIAAVRDNVLGIAGINPFCKIIPGRIYYQPNGVRPTEIALGIRKAVDKGARILNLSWKIQPSPLVTDAITYAIAQDCVVCAAAGNYLKEGGDKSVQFPGNLDNVITVAAHDNQGRWINLNNTPEKYRYGSCYGREVDISAPGIYIPTLLNGNRYDEGFFGTSAATAVVSAIAAMVVAVKPLLTADDVKNILFTTADGVDDGTSIENITERYGHGRINALEAVKMAHGF